MVHECFQSDATLRPTASEGCFVMLKIQEYPRISIDTKHLTPFDSYTDAAGSTNSPSAESLSHEPVVARGALPATLLPRSDSVIREILAGSAIRLCTPSNLEVIKRLINRNSRGVIKKGRPPQTMNRNCAIELGCTSSASLRPQSMASMSTLRKGRYQHAGVGVGAECDGDSSLVSSSSLPSLFVRTVRAKPVAVTQQSATAGHLFTGSAQTGVDSVLAGEYKSDRPCLDEVDDSYTYCDLEKGIVGRPTF